MGDIIRKDAAVDDIIADARASLTRAKAKGGVWQQVAEEKLAAGLAAVDIVEAKLTEANDKARPLLAAVPIADDTADALIGKIADDAWNILGRPAQDPFYEILFPGGITAYTAGPDEDQPSRMELLATLLESQVHPRLDGNFTKLAAQSIRDNIVSYQAAIDAARPYRLQIQLYSRTKTSLGRSLQLSLSSMKRRLKSDNFSEAEIHNVIPDRPRSVAATTATAPAPDDNKNPQAPATPEPPK